MFIPSLDFHLECIYLSFFSAHIPTTATCCRKSRVTFSQRSDIEKMASVLIQDFKAEAIFLANPWVAAMMAAGVCSRLYAYINTL